MREVRLTEALVPLRRSYQQAQRLVTCGYIDGRRDDNGKWWVDAADLERFIRDETASRTHPVRHTQVA